MPDSAVNLEQLGWNDSWQAMLTDGDSGMIPARVAREERQLYQVTTSNGTLLASVTGRFMNEAVVPADYPKVGDWVLVAPRWDEGRGTIHRVLTRRNRLSRKEPWVETAEQVIATNLDFLFVVSGLDRDFNVRRLERYMVAAFESGISPVIVLNKADLCPDPDAHKEEVEKAIPNTPVHTVSAFDGRGMDALAVYLASGRTIAFLGSSGVGKSTLINRLLGYERQEVRDLREGVEKGRHTTTVRELIRLPGGAFVVDNPGMRELQVWLDADDLSPVFGDIEALERKCRFSTCTHRAEVGCAVRPKIESGELDHARFKSYMKIRGETRRLEVKRKLKDKRIGKAMLQKRLRQEKKRSRSEARYF